MSNPFESIDSRLSNIESMLLDLKHNTKCSDSLCDSTKWFDLKELCNYLPDKPSKLTVYGWVSSHSIPFHKGTKKLRFLKSEIDNWLSNGKMENNNSGSKINPEHFLKVKRVKK